MEIGVDVLPHFPKDATDRNRTSPFAFTGNKRVFINGYELTFKEYLEELKKNPDTVDNALYAFMEDYGITKTYAQIENNPKLLAESFYIEKYCYLPFTKAYLASYFDFELKETINGKISFVAIANEECFRRATKISKDINNQLFIAHKVGFKEAVEMSMEINPVFKFCKYLKKMDECSDEYLEKILYDTFYWWLIDNYNKYLPMNKAAKDLFTKLDELNAKNLKYKKMIATKKIYALSVDFLSEFSRKLYLCYIEFVTLYRWGHIILKKKYAFYEYEFDKAYCGTYICQDFMTDRIVKLYSENSGVKEKEVRYNPLTGEEIIDDEPEEEAFDPNSALDDISGDAPIENTSEMSIDEINILKKKCAKVKRFAGFNIFVSIVSLLLIVAYIILGFVFANIDNEQVSTISNSIFEIFTNIPILISMLIGFFLSIIMNLVLNYKSSNTLDRLDDLLFINIAPTKPLLTVKQDIKLSVLMVKKDEIKKGALRTHKGLTAFNSMLLAMLISAVSIFAAAVIAAFMPIDFSNKINGTSLYIALYAPILLAILYGVLKKYKGMLSTILITFISLLIVIAVFLFM